MISKAIRITRVKAYQVNLPLYEGSYKWSGGKSVDTFDCTVCQIETNTGITGFGENTPLGPAYLAGISGAKAYSSCTFSVCVVNNLCLHLPRYLSLCGRDESGYKRARPEFDRTRSM